MTQSTSFGSLWSGLGTFLSTAKDKTLNIVDSVQTRIEDVIASPPPPKAEFDRSILPILETPSTYLDEPTLPAFRSYCESFDLSKKADEIAIFYDNSPNLKRLHARLVPAAISEIDFWSRLFFKLEQKQMTKKMSQDLMSHLKSEEEKTAVDDPMIELTPEELEVLEHMEAGNEDWNEWE
jgi:hypothetical protein